MYGSARGSCSRLCGLRRGVRSTAGRGRGRRGRELGKEAKDSTGFNARAFLFGEEDSGRGLFGNGGSSQPAFKGYDYSQYKYKQYKPQVPSRAQTAEGDSHFPTSGPQTPASVPGGGGVRARKVKRVVSKRALPTTLWAWTQAGRAFRTCSIPYPILTRSVAS